MKNLPHKQRDYHQIMTRLHTRSGQSYHANNVTVALVQVPSGYSERAISPIAFQEVSAYLQTEGLLPDKAAEKSYHAVKLFRSSDRILQYLQKWGEAGTQSLSRLLQDVPEINSRDTNLKKWGDAILQQGPRMLAVLGRDPAMMEPKRRYTHGAFSIRETQSHMVQNRLRKQSTYAVSFKEAQDHKHEARLMDPHVEFIQGLPLKR